MVYDPVRKKTVLFGGKKSGVVGAETWEWDGVSWTKRNPTLSPSPRWYASFAFDAKGQRAILYGGANGGIGYDDTWSWDGTTWSKLNPVVSPGARAGHAMSFDTKSGTALMFGGNNTRGERLDDLWEWNGTTWRSLTPAKPGKRILNGLVFDPSTEKTMLFGGYDRVPATYFSDTWTFDGTTWTKLSPPQSPSGFSGTLIVADTRRKRVLLAGGPQIWEWDGITWKSVGATPVPSGTLQGFTYDAARGKAVLIAETTTPATVLGVWEYDGVTWTRVVTPQSPPGGRYMPNVGYDEGRQRVVLYSGYKSGTVMWDDTWEYDGTTWVQRVTTATPAGLAGGTMAYDQRQGRLLLYGGAKLGILPKPAWSPSTWIFDGQNWKLVDLNVNRTPEARWQAGFCYDPVLGACVVAGGDGVDGQIWDTWLLGASGQAAVAAYGTGCAGGVGIPHLAGHGGSLPWLGEPFRASLTGIGAEPALHVPFLMLGDSKTSWGSTPLPLDLTSLGMPGCALRASPLWSTLLTNQNGQATMVLPIPNFAALLGATVHTQGGATDPDANPLGVVLSNGSSWMLGAR